jgi:hypothetical protein
VQARRLLAVGMLAGALAIGLSACGGSSSNADSDAPAVGTEHGNRSPQEVRAPDDEVADGLGQLKAIVNQIGDSASSDNNHAKDLQAEIEPIWESVEGTVKANDPSAYGTLADQFTVIGKAVAQKDGSAARTAAALVNKTADAYLAAHPGTSPSPSADAGPTASATP